jgi:hypothetical protein
MTLHYYLLYYFSYNFTIIIDLNTVVLIIIFLLQKPLELKRNGLLNIHQIYSLIILHEMPFNCETIL